MQQVQGHGAQIYDDRRLGAGAPICGIRNAKRQEMHARQEKGCEVNVVAWLMWDHR